MSDTAERRVIGPLGAGSVIAGTMLGVGILLTPPLVAAATSSQAGFYGLWLLGALVALAGADAYAELSAMLPQGGGDVIYQRRAFGPALAFASGTTMFSLAFAGSIAALAAACGTYQVQTLITAAGLDVDLAAPLIGPLTGARLVALAIVIGLTAANAAGARFATRTQTLLTVLPLVGLALLAVISLLTTAPAPVAELTEIPHIPLVDAWSGVYFAYAGWPAIVYVAGEIRQPGRTLPRAMLGGTALITALYLLLCAAFLHVLGRAGLAQAGEAGTAMVVALFGPEAGAGMAALVLMALLSSINGTILGGARVGAALFRHATVPRALLLQALLAGALVLSGSFQSILRISSLAMMVVGALTVSSQIVLRLREPDLPRPYATRAYPWSAIFFVAVSIGMVVLTVAGSDPALPLAGLVALAGLGLSHALLSRRPS